ncbi:hypothetical protein MRX96_028214 [Rhipicephalus microplus]
MRRERSDGKNKGELRICGHHWHGKDKREETDRPFLKNFIQKEASEVENEECLTETCRNLKKIDKETSGTSIGLQLGRGAEDSSS